MTLAGTLAAAKATPAWYLLILALIGAVAKTFASVIVYWISDKAEDLIVGRFGKYLGVSTKEVEKIGAQFSGKNRDIVVLTLARAIPIVPTSPVSIVCGIIKLHLRTYILGTLFGTYIRNVLYLLLGYYGLNSLDAINQGLTSMESVMQIVLVLVAGLVLAYLFYKRRGEQDILGTVKKWFRVK
jgi:membrane protein DedA with SNARE-associated domain